MPLDNNIQTTRTTLQGRWHETDWNWKVACQCCLRVPNQWPDSASWLPDQPWVSPKHALPAHFTRFLPDDLFVPVASEHSQCASRKKWFMQPVKMPRCSLAQPAVCLSVTHCSLHMQWLRCSSICFSLWLCVYVTMYVSRLLLLQRNTTPVFRRSFLSSSAPQQLAWSSLSPWSSSLLFATGESVLSPSLLHTVQIVHTGWHRRHLEHLNLAQKSCHHLNVCLAFLLTFGKCLVSSQIQSWNYVRGRRVQQRPGVS